MKIIAWNCNMVFRKKAPLLLREKPDIAIISECENPANLVFAPRTKKPTDIAWFGDNPHKGLGIFSYGNYSFRVHELHNPQFKTIVPIHVVSDHENFLLFAIWANNPGDKNFQYVGQVWKALHFYSELLNEEQIILAGDFNSNTIWDKPKREGNHSTVVKFLEGRNIHSTYHKFYNQQQGKEKHNTLFMYRHKDKPYHIDYCFASASFMPQLKEVKIGSHRKWCRYSDHTPLVVTFNSK